MEAKGINKFKVGIRHTLQCSEGLNHPFNQISGANSELVLTWGLIHVRDQLRQYRPQHLLNYLANFDLAVWEFCCR